MRRFHLGLSIALFATIAVTSMLTGCGSSTPSGDCGTCTAQPTCCSTSGGIQTVAVIVPECCNKCPGETSFAGMDNVTSGGPYFICTCNGC